MENTKSDPIAIERPGMRLTIAHRNGLGGSDEGLAFDLPKTATGGVVNWAEPWIQNHYLGKLCPQDIKDAKILPSPLAAVEAREFFCQRIKRSAAADKTFFPNEASNYQLGAVRRRGQFRPRSGAQKRISCDLPAEWFTQTLLP